jgi:hypothetical protein
MLATRTANFEHRYPIGIERERSSGWGERSSLAVLPLFLVGTVTDDQGLGFADALVSCLGNLQGVDVLPTSSVLNLPTEATASDIASRMGVHFVVHAAHSGIQRAAACFVGNV